MKTLLCTLTALALFSSSQSRAELFFSIYGGTMYTHDSDVQVRQSGGTDATFHDVSWDDKPFSGSPYGGYRLGYWFDCAPTWAVSIEWLHGKMVADLSQSVDVSGTIGGVPQSGSQPLNNNFQDLEFTHGHNLYTVNVHRRWFLGAEESIWARFEPYVGVGAGLARPHVQVTFQGNRTYEFQEAGFGCQGFGGVNINLARYFSIFAEYKLTYATIDAEIVNGSIETEPLSHHFNIGMTVHFGRAKR